MNKLKQIKYFKAPLFKKIGSNNLLETECLFGEKFLILDQHNSWSFGKLLTDNYLGWIKNKYLANLIETSHRVISLSTNIYKFNNPKSTILMPLSMGSLVKITDKLDNWFQVEIQNDTNKIYGYIPENHLVQKLDYQNDWLKIAEKMVDVPYVWGGRTSQGIDCSALLQITIKNLGIQIPRNTKEQVNFFSLCSNFKSHKIDEKICYDKGSIIFWDEHVGIISDKNKLLHSNAFHMKVIKEPIFKAIKRLGQKNLQPTNLYTFI